MWTLVMQAHAPDQQAAVEAQRVLMQRYHGAVYRYLLGATREEEGADELFQEFAMRFLRGAFQRADPNRGRFRDFVRTSLINLVTDYRRRAVKRGPALGDLQIDADQFAEREELERQFLASWREELLARAWEGLAQVEESGRQPLYTTLRMKAEEPQLSSAEIAARLNARLSPDKPYNDVSVRKTIQRAREKLSDLLLDEVAQSVGSLGLDEVEEELMETGLIAYCRDALARRRTAAAA
jgi:RNA polymerase sigma factor (sigma-70 family)